MTAVIQIKKVTELYKGRPGTLFPGITAEHAAQEITLITSEATEFETIAKQIAKDQSCDTDATVISIIQKGKHAILQNSLSKEFVKIYETELWSYKTFDTLKEFLESVLGSSLSKKEKVRIARQKLVDAVRYTKANEPFSVFLKRLENIAAPIKTNETNDVAQIFINDAFERNLTPENKTYLADQKQSDKTTKEIAKYLDESLKHIARANVNNIETSELSSLKEQMSNLSQQQAVFLSQQNTIMKLLSETAQSQLDVNKISTTQRPTTRKVQAKPNWKYTPDGKPVRCQQCGFYGHIRENCPRTCNLICHKCGKRGHLKAVCRNLAKNL